jgi:hypothetical protein
MISQSPRRIFSALMMDPCSLLPALVAGFEAGIDDS